MVWKQDELSPGATPAWPFTALENWVGVGKRERDDSGAPVRVPLKPMWGGQVTQSPFPAEIWRNTCWINDQEMRTSVYWSPKLCLQNPWVLTVNLRNIASPRSQAREMRLREMKLTKDAWFISGAAGVQTQIYLSVKFPFINTSLHFKNLNTHFLPPKKEQNGDEGGKSTTQGIG